MEKDLKTFTIEELIKTLKIIQKEQGNIPVILAKDYECNSYGNIAPISSFVIEGGKALVLRPYLDRYSLKELLEANR